MLFHTTLCSQGEKKKNKSTIFSNLTKSVIGWELLALIGRQIIICPLSGYPVRSRKRHAYRRILTVPCVYVYDCVSESLSDSKRENVLKGELQRGNQKGKASIRFCLSLE